MKNKRGRCGALLRSAAEEILYVFGAKKKEFNMRPRSGHEMRVMAIKKVTSAHWTVHDSFHSTASVDIQSHSSGPSQIPSSGALGSLVAAVIVALLFGFNFS